MNFTKIKIEENTAIKSNVFINEECNMILAAFEGDYHLGSKGNLDGLFIFSKITSSYFLYDTISVILLDFRNLNYRFGNTLLKSLNFFEEIGRDEEEKNKMVFIVVSKLNTNPILDLLNMKVKKNHFVYEDYDEAIKDCLYHARKYLED